MDDRERRIVSDMNTNYLSAQAMADIERLGVELTEGARSPSQAATSVSAERGIAATGQTL